MTVGRPPWIPSDEDLNKVENLASHGLTQEQIAHCLGIHPQTLSDKKQVFDSLNLALKKGKANGIAKVTAALLKNIDDGNVTAQIFFLKTQAGWKEAKDEQTNDAQTLMQKLIDKL